MLQHAWKLPLLDQLMHPDQPDIIHGQSEDALWGYFNSRSEAELFLKPTKDSAYKNDNIESVNIDTLSRIHSFDYAAMFFLQKLAKEGKLQVVTELSGQIGFKYISYKRYVDFPRDFVWQIVGRPLLRLDQERLSLMNSGSLRFYGSIEDTESCSALFCSGILPYLDTPFDEILRRLPVKPPVILLNEVSISEQAGFYMLETFGGNQVLHKAMTLPELEKIRQDLGYKLVSRWEIPEKSFIVGSLNGAETIQMIGEAWSLQEA